MRVLHISETDYEGGAGVAAHALHRELRRQGVESLFLAECVRQRDDTARSISGLYGFPAKLLRLIRSRIDALPLRRYPRRTAMAWSVGGLRRGALAAVRRWQPDLLHIHWVSQMLSVRDIGQLTGPVVWTHHDWGAFTGGCRCPIDCRRFATGCGACPLLGSQDAGDLSQRTCARKVRDWAGLQVHSIAVGSGIAADVRASQVLGRFPCEVIPNGIDVDRFQPLDRALARAKLGLAADAFVILFGAYSVASPWKGAAELAQALALWRQREPQRRACLATLGLGAMPPLACDLPVKALGFQASPAAMAQAYSAADLVVMPSRIESFGLMAAEAAACGTPTVAFAGTGVADIVRHGETGFLARSRDPAALADGLAWASALTPAARAQISVTCRRECVQRFALAHVAASHIARYSQLVANGSRPS
jgi:glycosyltransferase involved in cell wall biosynthesis